MTYPTEWQHALLTQLGQISERLDDLNATLTPPPWVAPRGLNPNEEPTGPQHDHRNHLLFRTQRGISSGETDSSELTESLGVTESGR